MCIHIYACRVTLPGINSDSLKLIRVVQHHDAFCAVFHCTKVHVCSHLHIKYISRRFLRVCRWLSRAPHIHLTFLISQIMCFLSFPRRGIKDDWYVPVSIRRYIAVNEDKESPEEGLFNASYVSQYRSWHAINITRGSPQGDTIGPILFHRYVVNHISFSY